MSLTEQQLHAILLRNSLFTTKVDRKVRNSTPTYQKPLNRSSPELHRWLCQAPTLMQNFIKLPTFTPNYAKMCIKWFG